MSQGFTTALFILTVLSVAALRRWLRYSRHHPERPRGTTMSAPLPAEYNSCSRERPFLFGNRWLSFEEARNHFLVVGSTGGGKTINITVLLKHVLRHRSATDSPPVRMMIYDSKTDQVARLSGLMSDAAEQAGRSFDPESITILNPFDARCCAWDIARDISDSSMAADVATVLVSSQPGANNPFFIETAQRLLEGVITAFIERAPGAWTLRDLIHAVGSPQRLRAIFESTEDTIGLVDFFEPRDTFNDVLSTLYGKLRPYKDIAAAWEIAGSKGNDGLFSLDDWLDSSRILVLGNSTRRKAGITAINQLLFTEASKVLLDRPGQGRGETWFFLDEVAELGKMQTLGDLMIRGRSKGACVVLGFQDMGAMEALYGQGMAESIVGAPGSVALLHLNDNQIYTQEWASRVVGQRQEVRTTKSRSRSTNLQSGLYGRGQYSTSTSEGENESRFTEPAFLPSQFGSHDPENGLPPIRLGHGMFGLYRIGARWVRHHHPLRTLFEDPQAHSYIGYKPAPGVQDLQPWPSPPKLSPWKAKDAQWLRIAGLADVLGDEPGVEQRRADYDRKLHSIRRVGSQYGC